MILQSTTYPGTTEQVIRPILERAGAVVGTDIFLGYAPERVDPGNKQWDVHTTPKLVSGVSEECLRRTALLYGTIVDTVVPVSAPIVAETAKLHENTFRAVNIALANELCIMCDRLGISSWEVIEAANTKPFGFLAHWPGPGLGGDCIPVVPHFLAWRLREYGYSAQLIDAAHEVNAWMPNFVLQKIGDALNNAGLPIKGSRILLLGMAYKANVADTRESPASKCSGSSWPAAATSATATRTSPASKSTTSSTRASTGPTRRSATPTASWSSHSTPSSSPTPSGTSRRSWSTPATWCRPRTTSSAFSAQI